MKNKSDHERLLVIDDEENMRHMLQTLLTKSGYEVDTAPDGSEGLRKIMANRYDFILCDLKMPRMDGMEFLKQGGERLAETTVIMMSAYGTVDTAIEAMKQGAYDYISKPFKVDEVLLTLKKAREREQLKRENIRLKNRIRSIEQGAPFGGMIAESRKMRGVFDLAEKVAQYDTTVLIAGESGTGKELIARGIHAKSARSAFPLVPINCGSIPENLLESELFGYKRGAFTGADKDKPGLFEAAEGGTIFLDEIGELPLSLQVKLLRVLQENEIRALGDSRTKKINVRVIAATARDLEREIQLGRFREDLFYRVNVVPIKLPPLRERIEDIPALCAHFIGRLNRRWEKTIQGIEPEAMSLLAKHHWPGNVRELENAVERAVILSEKNVLTAAHFSLPSAAAGSGRIADLFEGCSLKSARKIVENELIRKALAASAGNRTKACGLLEISHPALLSKIKAYQIDA